MSGRKIHRKHRPRLLSSCWKDYTRTSESAATKSDCSQREKNRPSNLRGPSNGKNRFAGEGRTTRLWVVGCWSRDFTARGPRFCERPKDRRCSYEAHSL